LPLKAEGIRLGGGLVSLIAAGRLAAADQAGGPGGRTRQEDQAGGPGGRTRREDQAGGPGGRTRRDDQAGGPGGRTRQEDRAGGPDGRTGREDRAGEPGSRISHAAQESSKRKNWRETGGQAWRTDLLCGPGWLTQRTDEEVR
jgi:hypothetical protein